MSEAYPEPTYQPLSGRDKQEQALNQTQRERREFELEVEREYKRAVSARFDDSVLVKIEYVDPARKKMKKPLVMGIGTGYFGFWSTPRPKKGLDAWQEWMPAGSALPRTDNHPEKWKLIYDPRGDVPVPNEAVIRAEMEAKRNATGDPAHEAAAAPKPTAAKKAVKPRTRTKRGKP